MCWILHMMTEKMEIGTSIWSNREQYTSTEMLPDFYEGKLIMFAHNM
jgi:hypothetical protein